jgi:hypothetical protein
MLMFFVVLAASVASAPVAQGSPSSSAPIVVIGQKISAADERLKACLARRCSPDEDIDATLALAENYRTFYLERNGKSREASGVANLVGQ